MQGTKVIVIDPEREYKQLAKSVKGTYIKLSATSQEKINPFDFSLYTATGENALAEHIQSLTEIISLMVGSLSDEEKAVVDKALIQTYKKVGITMHKQKASKNLSMPLLKDFYKELKSMKQRICVTDSISS